MFEQPPFFCKHEINEVKRFIEQQNNAFGYGFAAKLSHSQSPTPCHGCQELMDLGATCICVKRADCTSLWHPQCFICTQCKEFLVDLIYFYKDGQLYCERHHANLYKLRYTGCDHILFSFECIEAEGHGWNIYNVRCSKCQGHLDGERHIMRKGEPFCLNCFETMFPNRCDTCCERIIADQAQITRESHQWHATETCFCCYTCLIPLNSSSFLQDHGALFCSYECASQINNHSINTKLIQQNKFRQGPDTIPTSYLHTNQHFKTFPARPKNLTPQQQNMSHERIEHRKGYLSDGIDTRHRYNRNYQSSVFVQDQTFPRSIYSKEQTINIRKSRSHESIQFYNDINLEQADRHGVTLEILRCSTSISSPASLRYLSRKSFRRPKIKNYARILQRTLIDQAPSNRLNFFHSTGIMSVVSRPKSRITSQFPRSSSLNGPSRFTKQYRVNIVNAEKEKSSKYSPTMAYKSKSLCRSLSFVDDDNQEDLNSMIDELCIFGNQLQKSINSGTKLIYDDNETSTINSRLMKTTT
ncbi:unnamed protein product [Rotaria magnacalcarata]|uniref:LIM zinc-binding domain-containing protein n=6 Tax=Rotaria magnacalcarata TaxID=392030 RepID=A0A816SRM0_9BILA|nr:unnamed protein product [Rotaria magnacalcarata]